MVVEALGDGDVDLEPLCRDLWRWSPGIAARAFTAGCVPVYDRDAALALASLYTE
jgi:hypothetical protein